MARTPGGAATPGLVYSLSNILDNAVDFAADTVTVAARWSPEEVSLEIRDDGPGFAPDVLLRVGEPYVTTRGAADRSAESHEGGGLGLGLFIAKTLIERSGAELSFGNASPPATGAVTRIVWPRHAFERGAAILPRVLTRAPHETGSIPISRSSDLSLFSREFSECRETLQWPIPPWRSKIATTRAC